MIATGLNVPESLLKIGMINYSSISSVCLVVNNHFRGDGDSDSSPCMGDVLSTFYQAFSFSINDYSKYQNTVFFIFKLISKKQYLIIF